MLLSPQHAQSADAEGRILSRRLWQTNRLRGINKPLSIDVIYITHTGRGGRRGRGKKKKRERERGDTCTAAPGFPPLLRARAHTQTLASLAICLSRILLFS